MSRAPSRRPPSARKLALDLLLQFDRSPFPISSELEQTERQLADPRERHLARALVIEVLRHRTRLDWLISQWLRRGGVDDLPAPARNVLRVGAVQILLFDRVPPHAAVSSSVDLAHALGSAGLPGLVNAVLRKIAREGRSRWESLDASRSKDSGVSSLSTEPGDDPAARTEPPSHSKTRSIDAGGHAAGAERDGFSVADSKTRSMDAGRRDPSSMAMSYSSLALRYSHPEWLVSRWRSRWGDARTEAILRWDNTTPDYWLRLSPGAPPPPDSVPGWIPGTARLSAGSRPGLSEGFRSGEFTVQDGSAILVGWLPPEVAGLVVDLCAAPGTKLSHLMERAERGATFLALDQSPARLRRLVEGLGRIGSGSTTAGSSATPTRSNATPADASSAPPTRSNATPAAGSSAPPTGSGATPADASSAPPTRSNATSTGSIRVLVVAADAARIPARGPWRGALIDAPCSNLGVLRRRVDARWRVRPGEIPRLAALQGELLESAARDLQPGGWLVYSVCTVEPEETVERRKEFLRRHPDWEPIPLPEFVPADARLAEGEFLLLPGEHETDGTYAFAVRRPGDASRESR